MALRFFSVAEFECGCGCGRADMDPIFLGALDQLRGKFGRPMVVSSGFRCASHNQKVSSTGPKGPHTTGKAADIVVDRGDAYELIGLAIAAGFTGIGIKQHGYSRYVHLDTLRDAPGQPRPTVWSYA